MNEQRNQSRKHQTSCLELLFSFVRSNFEVSTDLDPILKAVLYLILMSTNGSIFAVSAKLGQFCVQVWV